MVKSGSFYLLFLMTLVACLEEALDPLTESQAIRLLCLDNSKTWSHDTYIMVFSRAGTSLDYLLQNNALDTLSFGTWNLSSNINEAFTDTIFFVEEFSTPQSPLKESHRVELLTSKQLRLRLESDILFFNSDL